MSSVLQQKIRGYIETNRLPVAAFEREAGLKTNVARNILRGASKRPTSDTLQAIASLMGCTISELLGEEEPKISNAPLRSALSPVVGDPELLLESLKATFKVAQEESQLLTIQQVFSLTEEAYHYALKKKSLQVDMDFVKWLLGRLKKQT